MSSAALAGEVSEVSVILSDKREFRAKIIGADEVTDLAVLKINATKLPTIPWGDSSKLRVAEWVLAIGNPFGVFNQSVTLGIVSATGRTVQGLGTESFIQTDAAINKGNSGGALINARGELVGINTAIYSETGGYQGIGLAVPSNLARKTLDELVKTGTIRRGTIAGIELATLTSEIAEQLRRARYPGSPRHERGPAGACGRCRSAPRRHHRRVQRHDDRRRTTLHPAGLRRADRKLGGPLDRPRRPPRHRSGADLAGAVPGRAAAPVSRRPDTAALPAA